MKKKFMIIDGSSLIFRAFYAIRNLTTKDGIFTNGVYGFLNMYYKMVEQYGPDNIVVVFDRSAPTFRHEDYEAYKGNRDKAPSELSSQFGILKDILNSMNVVFEEQDGYEADDIAGTLAKKGEEEGYEVLLVTGDRDYLQLVDNNIEVLLTKKGISEVEIYDLDAIKEKYELTPEQLIDVKGLMGDASDNIPGVPGVGEKTALKLIKGYGSIEEVYKNIDNVSGKALKKKLEENETLAYLSKKLGTIFLNVPMDLELEKYETKDPEFNDLKEKFEKLEFNSFIKKLPLEEIEYEENFNFKFENDSSEIISKIKSSKEGFVFHIFYNGDNYIYSSPEILAIKIIGEDEVSIFNLKEKNVVKDFKEVFENDSITKISYDSKSDFYYTFLNEIEIKAPYEDLTIAEYLIDPSKSKYEIDKAAKIYLNRDLISGEEVFGKGKKKKNYLDVEEEILGKYIAMYMSVTEDLRKSLIDILEEREMHELYYGIELPLVKVLASMEFEGFSVNKEYLKDLGIKFDKEIEELEKLIYKDAGGEFNINSPKQLGEILFEKLNLPVIKKTKTGYSTDAEVLDKLTGSHEIIERILRYRTVKKLNSTYIEGLLKLVGEDGRIHSTFNQTIAVTGRISSIDPNLQNIPVKTEEGRLIRKAFVAGEGKKLVDADYSQIELRVLAHLANDEIMLNAFKDNIDIHTKTASEVFNVDIDKVTSLDRSNAKAVNFGIVYGIGDYSLSQDLKITRKEAKEYIENYLNTYKGIKKYMEDIVEIGKEQGYVETIMHRRRYIPELNSKNFNIRGFGERVALNTPIQGSAADIIKIAMVQVYNKLKEEKFKSKLILQVHDELIIETFDDEVEKVEKLLKNTMENAVKLNVELRADINVGNSWYDSK
ncbi:DNA polymerase I [Miniphocaeibacter massiliensis]|uniref:DNA polymerase I n=1 Tax=Miniphocaeibacter massiliensis TaxID=2041841 RepID=UPI000C1BAE0B|nr:DNA polymerase I [Miniphocaeibacter massiliensis]